MTSTRYWDDLVEGESLDCRPVVLGLEEIVEFARKFDPQLFHIDSVIKYSNLDQLVLYSGHGKDRYQKTQP